MENNVSMKLSDQVISRVVQIIQEAMLLGVDCVDIMRQIRVQPDSQDATSLVLTPEYEQQVEEMHSKLLAQAEDLQANQNVSKLIIE